MKDLLKHIFDDSKANQELRTKNNNAYSIRMDFEDNLLESSREMSSFSDDWVSEEIERSKLYFYETIKKA
ncbi:hypothetical protein ACPA5B_26405 [Pseudomonas solani]|uniref:hypothetical protein n=1 Tax=Pseudomonas solani TaxID=2731552 RepID=UPI003C3058D1